MMQKRVIIEGSFYAICLFLVKIEIMKEKGFTLIYKDAFLRLFKFLYQPKREWKVVENEVFNRDLFLINYILPILGLFSIILFLVGAFSADTFSVNMGLKQAVSFFAAYFGVYYFLLFLLDGYLSKQEVADSNALSSYLIGYSILITSIFGLIAAIHPLLVGVLILSLFGAMVFVVGLNQLLNVSNQKKIVLALSFSFLLLTLPPALYQLLAKISTL